MMVFFFLAIVGAPHFVACSYIPEEGTTSVEYSESGAQLAERIQGRWQINSRVHTTCPLEYITNPLEGVSLWTAEKHKVEVSTSPNDSLPLELSAIDETTLVRSFFVEWRDCTVYEDVTVRLDSLTSSHMRGEYTALYHHNGSQLCIELTKDYDIDETCEMTVRFVGYRI